MAKLVQSYRCGTAQLQGACMSVQSHLVLKVGGMKQTEAVPAQIQNGEVVLCFT